MMAMMKLAGRLALVTGGGSGIGRAVCVRLARDGASVAVADLSAEAAAATVSLLAAELPGQRHAALAVDVGDRASVQAMLARLQEQAGEPPSLSVSAAGIIRDQMLLRMDEEAFDHVIRVNLKGTFLVTQAVAQSLVAARAASGSIINIGSIVGKVGNVGQCNYSASKAGVEGLTKSTAKELARFGIRCNAVLPGFIETPMTAGIPPKVMEKLIAAVPMRRMGTPEEVADVCAFLASDDSRYITGVSLEVTGGLFL
ncbi:unnamed protein product [Lampetra fluviatilis]